MRINLVTVMTVVAVCSSPAVPAQAGSVTAIEMQQARPSAGGAMTPQRARRECWQAQGFAPNLPRNAYPARLVPLVDACVAQRIRRR